MVSILFSSLSRLAATAGLVIVCSGCSSIGSALNPFQEEPLPEAYLGERTDAALNNQSSNEDSARKALEAMATYQGAQEANPYKPVMNPAIVRMMWIPDRVNRHGQLIPAHYMYIKVKGDGWAVQDAFELERQNNGPSGGSRSSSVPYVYEAEKQMR